MGKWACANAGARAETIARVTACAVHPHNDGQHSSSHGTTGNIEIRGGKNGHALTRTLAAIPSPASTRARFHLRAWPQEYFARATENVDARTGTNGRALTRTLAAKRSSASLQAHFQLRAGIKEHFAQEIINVDARKATNGPALTWVARRRFHARQRTWTWAEASMGTRPGGRVRRGRVPDQHVRLFTPAEGRKGRSHGRR